MSYPLIFNLRDLITGDGFVAAVEISGRALQVDEGEEGIWIYGVNPGGLAGGGEDQGSAWLDFREGYRSVLFDLAAASESISAFARAVGQFFRETNEGYLQEWDEAHEAVRRGEIESDLPRVKTDDSDFNVRIVRIAEREEPAAPKEEVELEPPAAAFNQLDGRHVAA